MKQAWPFSIGFLFPVAYAASVFSFSIKAIDKQSLTQKEEEVNVTLTINELPSESYFRVAFQPKKGGSYFGYIKNEKGEWTKIRALNSEDCSGYYRVTDMSTKELVVGLIIGGENEVNNEEYVIKGHRFTAACPKSYDASDNSISVSFAIPSPSPSPSPSASLGVIDPSPSPSTSSESNQTTASPSPSTPLGTIGPSPQPSRAARVKDIILLELETPEPVLGTQSGETRAKSRGKPDWQLVIMLILTGTGLLLTTAIIMIKLWRKK